MTLDLNRLGDEAKSLITWAKAGDEEALGRLMDLFRGYLLTVAAGELSNQARAKVGPSDVVQDTFLEAYRVFVNFQGEGVEEFRAWLRAILRHKVTDLHDRYLGAQMRRVDREVSFDQGESGGLLREILPGTEDTPSTQVAFDEEVRSLYQAIEGLPEESRQVIIWRQWDRLSFVEIGRRLGRSEEAARKHYVRSLERLSDALEKGHARGVGGAA